jgi:hypothetical protein
VVSEYFAQVFEPTGQAVGVDGLMYPSAVRPGGKNLVLFPSRRRWARTFDAVAFVSADNLQLSHWADIVHFLKI